MKIVNIYSNKNCGACDMAKAFMDEEGIDYLEHRVDKDSKAMKHLVEKGIMRVPYFEIGKESFVGHNPDKIMALTNVK